MKGLPLTKRWRQQTEDEYRELVRKSVDAFGDKLYVKDGLLWGGPDSLKDRNLRNMWRQLRR